MMMMIISLEPIVEDFFFFWCKTIHLIINIPEVVIIGKLKMLIFFITI